MGVNIKEKAKSMQFKLFATLCISTFLVVVAILIVNDVILVEVYKYYKIQIAKNLYNKINEYYETDSTYAIDSELRQIEIKNNIEVLILNDNGDIAYFGNKDILETVNAINKVSSTLIEKEQNMERTLRNTLIGAFITVLVAFVGAWIQLNSRISILEVQVQNDHNLFMDNGHDMKELKDKVTDIQIKVTELGTRQQQDEYGHGKEYQ